MNSPTNCSSLLFGWFCSRCFESLLSAISLWIFQNKFLFNRQQLLRLKLIPRLSLERYSEACHRILSWIKRGIFSPSSAQQMKLWAAHFFSWRRMMKRDYVYTSEIRESLQDIVRSTYHHLITVSSQAPVWWVAMMIPDVFHIVVDKSQLTELDK